MKIWSLLPRVALNLTGMVLIGIVAIAGDDALAQSGTRAGLGQSVAAQVGDPEIIAVIKNLQSADARVSSQARDALEQMQRSGRFTEAVLVPLLKHSDVTVRGFAIDRLGSLGRPSSTVMPQLIAVTKDPDSRVQVLAIQTLGKIGDASPELIKPLLAIVQDGQQSLDNRSEAAKALGQFQGSAKTIVPPCIVMLNSADSVTRAGAIKVLGQMRSEAKTVIPYVLMQFEDQDFLVRAVTIDAFASLGELAEPALPELLAMLRDPNERVSYGAVQAIGKMGKAAQGAIPRLLTMLEKDDRAVRQNAVMTLDRMGDGAKDAVPGLIKLLKHSDPAVQSTAMAAIGRMGDVAIEAMPELIALLKHRDELVRLRAVEAFGGFGKETLANHRSQMIGLLQDPKRIVRFAAITVLVEEALNWHYSTQQAALINVLLQSSDPWIRSRAVIAIGNTYPNAIWGNDVLPQLQAMLQSETNSEVRAVLVETLDKVEKIARSRRPGCWSDVFDITTKQPSCNN